jgi:hypothetical protein
MTHIQVQPSFLKLSALPLQMSITRSHSQVSSYCDSISTISTLLLYFLSPLSLPLSKVGISLRRVIKRFFKPKCQAIILVSIIEGQSILMIVALSSLAHLKYTLYSPSLSLIHSFAVIQDSAISGYEGVVKNLQHLFVMTARRTDAYIRCALLARCIPYLSPLI